MDQQKVPKLAALGILGLLGFMLFMSSYFVVDAGERGVILRFGAVDRVMPEGLHFKIPFMEDVIRMTVRVQKITTKTEAASQDLQIVQSTMVLNYSLTPEKVGDTYRTLGLNRDVSEKIINPSIEESFKAAAARYTAEELISKREALKTQVREYLRDRLAPFGIIVIELSITDFQFSAKFNEAIESKQTAEQHALRAKRDLDRVRVEAQQKIATAQADAEALRLQRQVISPDLIKLRQIDAQIKAIEKWDGKLPNVTGGAVPFIQVETMKEGVLKREQAPSAMRALALLATVFVPLPVNSKKQKRGRIIRMRPSEREAEHFARIEFENKKKLEEEKHKRLAEEEKKRLKALHAMKCPKCGMELIEIDYKEIKIDKCSECAGVWLDAGEMEQVAKMDKTGLDKLFSVFKK